MRYFVGWDVGAWHCDKGKSRDALCVLENTGASIQHTGIPWRGNLRDYLQEENRDLRFLLDLCTVEPEEPFSVTLAIDATLGWPESMQDLINGSGAIDTPQNFRENRYLFRKTERHLAKLGFEPFSAVQDMIGSQSTKAIHLLNVMGFNSSSVGIWKYSDKANRYTVIETYPAPCHSSENFRSEYAPLLKDEPFAKYLQDNPGSKNDVPDALACAIIAYLFSEHYEMLQPPFNSVSHCEGWIWVPEDIGH